MESLLQIDLVNLSNDYYRFSSICRYILQRMAQFPEIPVTVISNFKLKFLSNSTILFQVLQTKMIIKGRLHLHQRPV